MKKEKTTINFKGFLGRLFCLHNHKERINDLEIHQEGLTYPINKYWRFICKDCGKVIKYKQF